MTLPRHQFKKAWEWAELFQSKKSTPQEAFEEYSARAKASKLNAFISLTLEETKASLATMKSSHPLAGIPFGIKDNLITKGVRTTCGSKILENYHPPYDATVVDRLNQSGVAVVGKCNMDEFAMGSSNEHSAYGTVGLPQDPSRVPGGSSGGSAAAVAGNLVVLSLGSDTGGSVRQPAAFCGLVGLKPTYGRVSRFGLVAYASSLDQVGTFSLDAIDNAQLLQTISGHDIHDATSSHKEVPDFVKLTKTIKTDKAARSTFAKALRIGLPKEYFAEGLDPGVRAKVEAGIQALRGAGCEVVEVSLPNLKYGLPVYYVVAVSEASANLARFDGVRFGPRVLPNGVQTSLEEMYEHTRGKLFGAEVKRRILLGTFTLSSGYYDAYFRKACQVRNLISRDFAKAFEEVDVLLGPTTPTVSFKSGEKTSDPLAMYLSDTYTVPINLAGIPALSMPIGESQGLPVGLQLVSAPFREDVLLQTAALLEVEMDEGRIS